jgi:tetratricopeptide (TPR) repeat protein
LDPLPLLFRFALRLGLWRPARLAAAAEAELAAGNLAAARKRLDECCLRAPAWAEPWYLLSRCAQAGGATRGEEEALLLAALERDPGHESAERALLEVRAWRFAPLTEAWHLYHGGRTNDAREAFQSALIGVGERLPEFVRGRVLAGIGWCHHDLGDLAHGVAAFDEALAEEPQLAHAHKGRGIALYKLGRFTEAEAALELAVAWEPKLHDALAFIGWCRYAMQRYDAALEVFERTLIANPLLGDAAWGVAWSLFRLRDMDRAEAAFCHAAALEPSHPSATEVARWVLPLAPYAALAERWREVLCPGTPAPVNSAPSEQPLVEALAALQAGEVGECLAWLEKARPTSARERWQARVLAARAAKALGRAHADLDCAPKSTNMTQHG